MDINVILGWLIPLIASIITGIVAIVIWIVKLAIDLTSLKKDNEQQAKELERLDAQNKADMEWNRGQHKELFDRNNEDAKTLVELKTLFENMDKKIDEILDRERSRNGINH